MSDATVRPALTPESWRGVIGGVYPSDVDIAIGLVWASLSSNERDLTGDVEVMEEQFGERRPMLVIHWNLASDRIAIGDRHALAALALHGQPFGFTQEDVDLLTRSAEYYDWLVKQKYLDDAEKFRSLAARIAALLPPEAP